MDVHRLPLPPLGANCYLLQKGDAGLIVDPGGDAGLVVSACKDLGLVPQAVLLTHGHFDHVGAVAELLDAWPGLELWCHSGDLTESDEQLFPLPRLLGGRTPRLLQEGQVLDLAGLEVQILHTPGHSAGSCCFLVEGCLFTGDTLFRFSMGRTDLPGGDAQEMARSLGRLAALEGDLTVYPGHDAPTTLDHERAHNPYLQVDRS